MDRNDRNILILGILILILLAVAYYFLLFSPLRQEYTDRFEERAQKEQQKAQLEQTVAQLENVRRNSSDIERQILEYSKRVPEQDEIPTLVVQIEEVAEGADVTQVSITPGSPEAPQGGGDFSRIPVTMTFEGTYDELTDFLQRVRNLARLVTVNEVNYEPVEEEAGRGGETTVNREVENLLAVEIIAETYVQPAAGGEVGAGGGTAPAGGGTAAPPPAADKGGAAKGGAKGGVDKGGGAKAGAGKDGAAK